MVDSYVGFWFHCSPNPAIQQHPGQGAVSSLRCGPHQPLDPVLSRPLGAARRPVDNFGELPTALLTATRHLKNDRSYLKSSLLLPAGGVVTPRW